MGAAVGEGRTRWKRFAGVLALSLLATGVLMFALAQGAIGASFAVSGSNFKISADRLRGSGFAQFVSIDRSADGAHPVATTNIRAASMDSFCQSALAPEIPLVGDVSLVIRANGRESVQASNLVVNIDNLAGGLSFQGADIGVDASQLSKGAPDVVGQPGAFGLQADGFVLDDMRGTAWRVTASTLTLNGVGITVTADGSECF